MIELDIRASSIASTWELMMRAVRHHTDCAWVLLYIERWLKAPCHARRGVGEPGKGNTARVGGQPALGEPFSSLCVRPMDERKYPDVPFERYADDAIFIAKARNRPGCSKPT